MRVITGTARGRVLKELEGLETRPTTGKVKESLFSIIQFDIEGRRVLDLFAGSGALGLEAVSRGAESAVFCDSARESIDIVNANIKKLGYGNKCRVYHCDWERAVSMMAFRGDRFDIVFIDPPYGAGISDKAAATLYDKGLLAEGFIIALEHDSKLPPMIEHDKLEIYDVRHYGELTAISFIRERQ